MNMNKTIGAIIIVVVVVAGGWYILEHSNKNGGENAAVANVNGTLITRHQLTAAEMQLASQQGAVATSTAVQAQFQASALDLLIGQTLLEQAAEKAGITASSTVVDAELASDKTQFTTPGDYDKALAARGMTESDLRLAISNNLLIGAHLEQQLKLSTATATPAEIQTAYKQIASGQTGTSTPPLAQVRDQVARMVLQQKQQDSINAYVAQLRSAANIQILIATSTPAAQ